MAIRKIENAAYLATDWQSEIESKNILKKGVNIYKIDFENKLIKAGSIIESNEVLYSIDTDMSVVGSTTINNSYFIYFNPLSLNIIYSTETPIYLFDKNGWYGSINSSYKLILRTYIDSNSDWKYYQVFDYEYDNIFKNEKYNLEISDFFMKTIKKLIIEINNLEAVIEGEGSGYFLLSGVGGLDCDYNPFYISEIQSVINDLITKINNLQCTVPGFGTFSFPNIDTTDLWPRASTIYPFYTFTQIKQIINVLITQINEWELVTEGSGNFPITNIDINLFW